MPNTPPVNTVKREHPSGQLEKIYCKKCKRQLSLRDINIKDNKIKCKKCGIIVLEVKD